MSGHNVHQRQEQAIKRFNELLDILQDFTRGDQSSEVETGNGSIPTLRKWLAKQQPEVALAAFLGADGRQGDALRVGEYGHGAGEVDFVEDVNQIQNQGIYAALVDGSAHAVIHIPIVAETLAVQIALDPVSGDLKFRSQVAGIWAEDWDLQLTTRNTISDSNGYVRRVL